jgi:hypothetical protein
MSDANVSTCRSNISRTCAENESDNVPSIERRPMFQVPVRFGAASFWCWTDRLTNARTAMHETIVFVMRAEYRPGSEHG